MVFFNEDSQNRASKCFVFSSLRDNHNRLPKSECDTINLEESTI
jgi:hypothetical protein